MFKTDAFSLYAKPSADFSAKLAHTQAQLQTAAAHGPAGTVVLANSLGAEDMVLTHLVAAAKLPIASFVLQTGQLHPQTLALIPFIHAHYDHPVEVFEPQAQAVVEFVGRHGEQPMRQSVELRKACCALRKLEPLGRALASKTAWVTGLRREQSDNRADVPFVETPDGKPAKYNPLAEWTQGDVWHFIQTNRVPYNPLHDQLMPSIGCAPCTRAITVGEDIRAGRWWWEREGGEDRAQECGLHVAA